MTVLVATNASPEGRAALVAGALEAKRRGTDLVYLNLGRDPLSELPDLDVERAVEIERDPQREAVEALLEAAQEHSADLIVIGMRRRRPVGKLILGSMAQRVLLDSPVPVLSVKDSAG